MKPFDDISTPINSLQNDNEIILLAFLFLFIIFKQKILGSKLPLDPINIKKCSSSSFIEICKKLQCRHALVLCQIWSILISVTTFVLYINGTSIIWGRILNTPIPDVLTNTLITIFFITLPLVYVFKVAISISLRYQKENYIELKVVDCFQ